MLIIKDISKSFAIKVINNLSYSFVEGNLYKVNGKNGSGKTTLLKIMKGVYTHDSGSINFKAPLKSIHELSYIDNNARSFIQRLTVKENLRYFCSLNSIPSFKNSLSLIEYFDCQNLLHKKFSELSSGQMQLISFIRGVSFKPKVLLLDEIFSPLDINVKAKVKDFINKYVSKNNAIAIITSHQDEFKDVEIINLDK
mgnify:CR=1 FL=1|tara:strand:+ start:698 stop:1288 length:591 start_codon:yes stop_codon:yes gene_type:complete